MTNNNPTTENAGTVATHVDGAAYWRKNLSVLGGLLVVWFVCSFGFGILFVEQMNQIEFLGVKLGFWFAQQGSIYIFIALMGGMKGITYTQVAQYCVMIFAYLVPRSSFP